MRAKYLPIQQMHRPERSLSPVGNSQTRPQKNTHGKTVTGKAKEKQNVFREERRRGKKPGAVAKDNYDWTRKESRVSRLLSDD